MLETLAALTFFTLFTLYIAATAIYHTRKPRRKHAQHKTESIPIQYWGQHNKR